MYYKKLAITFVTDGKTVHVSIFGLSNDRTVHIFSFMKV